MFLLWSNSRPGGIPCNRAMGGQLLHCTYRRRRMCPVVGSDTDSNDRDPVKKKNNNNEKNDNNKNNKIDWRRPANVFRH
jgi:hypothetical protein